MEEWMLFSILVLITASTSRIGFKLLGNTNPFLATLLIELTAVIVGALIFLYYRPKIEVGTNAVLGLVIIGVSVTLLDLFFIKAVNALNNVSIVQGIMNLATVFVALFLFVFFKEEMNVLNWLGIFLGTISLMLLAYR